MNAPSARFDPAAHPRKLNLGCGSDHRAGYLNIDVNAWYRPDLVADIRKLDFMPSAYYDEIVAQDVLEHLPRVTTLPTLYAWNRLLRQGGRLLLRVPSILGIADLLRDKANASPSAQEHLVQCLFGTQAYSGDFHYTGFTETLLRYHLEQAGFHPASLSVLHGWLLDATAEKVRHFESSPVPDFSYLLEERDDALFVERCYAEVLRRVPDESGRIFFMDGLTRGMGRHDVIQVMLGSDEYRALKK